MLDAIAALIELVDILIEVVVDLSSFSLDVFRKRHGNTIANVPPLPIPPVGRPARPLN